MYLNFAFAVTPDAVFVIYVKTEGRRASEILSVPTTHEVDDCGNFEPHIEFL